MGHVGPRAICGLLAYIAANRGFCRQATTVLPSKSGAKQICAVGLCGKSRWRPCHCLLLPLAHFFRRMSPLTLAPHSRCDSVGFAEPRFWLVRAYWPRRAEPAPQLGATGPASAPPCPSRAADPDAPLPHQLIRLCCRQSRWWSGQFRTDAPQNVGDEKGVRVWAGRTTGLAILVSIGLSSQPPFAALLAGPCYPRRGAGLPDFWSTTVAAWSKWRLARFVLSKPCPSALFS